MSVNGVSNQTNSQYVQSAQNYNSSAENQASQTSNEAAKQEEQVAAVYEKGDSKSAKKASADITRMIRESNQKVDSMREMLKSLVYSQAEKNAKSNGVSVKSAYNSLKQGIANGDNVMVEVSDEVRAKAAQEVSEDGYYGVKQTSQRILDFAKAIVTAYGNDPEMINKMEAAVKEGFKQAEEMWGEKMPQITQDTYDAVMKGFSDWRDSLGIAK